MNIMEMQVSDVAMIATLGMICVYLFLYALFSLPGR